MLPFLILLACSETGLSRGTVSNDTAPDIVVTPASLDFGAVPLGELATAAFSIGNQGDAVLTVAEVGLSGDLAFALVQPVEGLRVSPGDEVEVLLSFSPVNTEDGGFANVYSDDPDEPALPVALSGRGAFPLLVIDPNPVELSPTELCEDRERAVALRNEGEAPLQIDQALISGEGLELSSLPALPVVLAPGEAVEATVHFEPGRAAEVSGELWIGSDDPAGARRAPIAASGVVDGLIAVHEEFRQPDGPWEKSDILFFIDRSCSMKDDEANLAANIELLSQELGEALDWQMMVTIDDNGCHDGEFFTRDTPELVEDFQQVLGKGAGTFTEAGLTIVANGLERSVGGGCNEGFLRSGSKTLLILISDEPEQSPEPWQDYVTRMRAVAPAATVVAVVGDVPGGCPTAEPGTGYVDAAMATGGVFLSICSTSWGSYFDTIGQLATEGPRDRFWLSRQPEPTTIVVTVDGEPSFDWTYDALDNSLLFSVRPPPLALVEVDYALTRDCEAGDSGG